MFSVPLAIDGPFDRRGIRIGVSARAADDAATIPAASRPARLTDGGIQVLVYSPESSSWGHRLAEALGAAAPAGASVRRCRSRTELLLRCSQGGPSTVALLDGSVPDHLVDRPSERLIRRIRSVAPTVRVVSVCADPTPDVHAGATRAGATVMGDEASVWQALGLGDSPNGPLTAAAQGRPRWTVDAWRDWVLRSYGITLTSWTEPALALLAAGAERAVLAQDLVDTGIIARREVAVRAVRDLSKDLAAEEYRNTGAVAREAHRVLAGLSCARPLSWRPSEPVSLQRASAALEAEPSLACAAVLRADEQADLLQLWRAITAARDKETPGVGAPIAGRGRQERRWAAGRRAAELGADATSIDALADVVLAQATDAAHAILDARHDALGEPRARVAAALLAIARLPPSAWPRDVSIVDGEPAWKGATAGELLADTSAAGDACEARAVVAAIDAQLRLSLTDERQGNDTLG